MNKESRIKLQGHPFHLVELSPWPILTSFSLLILTMSGVLTFHGYNNSGKILIIGIILVIISMIFWWRDVISESTYQGHHTLAVQKGITIGVFLFIISEIFFFLSIFWAFFHSSLAPSCELGSNWPPLGIEPLNPFELPLLNTIILLSSGGTVTYAHHSLINGNRKSALLGLIFTIILAIIFTLFQGLEYYQAPFTISDGIYGTCFYFGTGFHGLHVIIGTLFLSVALWRLFNYHITNHHHLGLESSILYWHFVDIVWLFLFISIYWWGS